MRRPSGCALLHTGYLVSEAVQRLAHTGLMRDVNSGKNKEENTPVVHKTAYGK